jgi:hypothetical protein
MGKMIGLTSASERFVKKFSTVLHEVSKSASFDPSQIRLFKNKHDWWEVEFPQNVVTKAALSGYLMGKSSGWMITGESD